MSTTRRVSLSSLAVNPPPGAPASTTAAPTRKAVRQRAGQGGGASSEQVSKLTSDAEVKMDERVQVAFRMDRDAYKELRRQALDEDVTVNDLILAALNQYRAQKGLKKLAS